MALINCPECKKEISDHALSCPYCGFPMALTPAESGVDISQAQPEQPLKSKSRKPLFLVLVLVVVAIVAVAVGIYISGSNRAAALEAEARENYIQTMRTARYAMLSGAADAEATCNLISSVWHNSIYKKTDSTTDRYTKLNGKFYDDFNNALSALFRSDEYKDQVGAIKADRTVVDNYMQELQNPPDGLETAYNTLCDMYEEFTSLTSMAINPTGSLQTFNQSFSSYDNAFMRYYDKLGTQIPEN